MKRNCVYIMSNRGRSVFYVGVTSDLVKRRLEHQQEGPEEGFCGKYNVRDVIYVERFDNIVDAIAREQQIKKCRREKKLALILSQNPDSASLPPPFFELTAKR